MTTDRNLKAFIFLKKCLGRSWDPKVAYSASPLASLRLTTGYVSHVFPNGVSRISDLIVLYFCFLIYKMG